MKASWRVARGAALLGLTVTGAGAGFPVAGAAGYPSRWQPLGPDFVTNTEPNQGRLNGVAVPPGNPGRLVVTSPAGGIWTSADGGGSWTPRTDSLPFPGATDVRFDPQDPRVLYAATGDARNADNYSLGVWKSRDGGASWAPTGLRWSPGDGRLINRLVVDPTDGRRLFVAATDGLYFTRDGGTTWLLVQPETGTAPRPAPSVPLLSRAATRVRRPPTHVRREIGVDQPGKGNGVDVTPPPESPGVPADGPDTAPPDPGLPLRWDDVCFQPGNPAVVYASGRGGHFFRSRDGGITWQATTADLPTPADPVGRTALAVSPATPRRVYLLCVNRQDGSPFGLYVSENGGRRFALRRPGNDPVLATINQGNYALAMMAHPHRVDDLYVGGLKVLRSTDAGASWQLLAATDGTSPHADVHALAFLDADARTLLCCSDGGLTSINPEDPVRSWRNLSAGLTVAQPYFLGVDERHAGRRYLGTQDNGLLARTQGVWRHLGDGDVSQVLPDPDASGLIYFTSNLTAYTTGALWRFALGVSRPGLPTPLFVTSEDSKSLGPVIAATRTTDGLNGALLAGFRNLFRSTDEGENWQQLSSFDDAGLFLRLGLSAADPNTLYASRFVRPAASGGDYTGQLVRSTDGGVTWQDLSARLGTTGPTLIYSLAVSATDPRRIWVATDSFAATPTPSRVLSSIDGGNTWEDDSVGLPGAEAFFNVLASEGGASDALYLGTSEGVFYRAVNLDRWEPFSGGLPSGADVTDLHVRAASRELRGATYGRGLWKTALAAPATGPVVNVAPTVTGAGGSTEGELTLTRAGDGADLAAALTVSYQTGGSAVPDVDYEGLPGRVLFPVGRASVTVKVTPRASGAPAGNRALWLKLLPGEGYVVGYPAKAKVRIIVRDTAGRIFTRHPRSTP